jgi:hypothetical protein
MFGRDLVSSYTLLNSRARGATKRLYFRVAGDRTLLCVKMANRIARRVAYMLEFHFKKNQFYILENPLSSLLWKFKCIHNCLKRHGAKRVVVHLACYGASTLKPVPSIHMVHFYFSVYKMSYLPRHTPI